MTLPVPAALPARAAHADRLVTAALGASDTTLLDALVEATARELDAETVHVSILTDQQVTAGACGPVISRADRGQRADFEDTICANALRLDGPLVIPDAKADARVSSIPLVQEGKLGAYLGSPLRAGGDLVGVLCVWQAGPRDWSADELAVLERRAAEVVEELERLASDGA